MTQSPRSPRVYFFVILLLTVGGIAHADVEYQGIVGPTPGGADTCLHPTAYVLTDSYGFIMKLESSQADLNALVGQDMRVSGPDIGLECAVIDVQSATAVPVAGAAVRRLLLLPGARPATSRVVVRLLHPRAGTPRIRRGLSLGLRGDSPKRFSLSRAGQESSGRC